MDGSQKDLGLSRRTIAQVHVPVLVPLAHDGPRLVLHRPAVFEHEVIGQVIVGNDDGGEAVASASLARESPALNPATFR
jgi:hypothetical protein